MITKEANESNVTSVGQKLLDHSKAAEFTARRGLALELFPFIFGAGQRMSARAISDFLVKEQGVKLSSVTINKALKDPHRNWNLYFDEIERAARIFAKEDGMSLKDFLFQQQYFYKPVKNRIVRAAVKMLVRDDVAHSANILRTKWFAIDLDIRMKARPYLEERLQDKESNSRI
jgi:hypothetical protein